MHLIFFVSFVGAIRKIEESYCNWRFARKKEKKEKAPRHMVCLFDYPFKKFNERHLLGVLVSMLLEMIPSTNWWVVSLSAELILSRNG